MFRRTHQYGQDFQDQDADTGEVPAQGGGWAVQPAVTPRPLEDIVAEAWCTDNGEDLPALVRQWAEDLIRESYQRGAADEEGKREGTDDGS